MTTLPPVNNLPVHLRFSLDRKPSANSLRLLLHPSWRSVPNVDTQTHRFKAPTHSTTQIIDLHDCFSSSDAKKSLVNNGIPESKIVVQPDGRSEQKESPRLPVAQDQIEIMTRPYPILPDSNHVITTITGPTTAIEQFKQNIVLRERTAPFYKALANNSSAEALDALKQGALITASDNPGAPILKRLEEDSINREAIKPFGDPTGWATRIHKREIMDKLTPPSVSKNENSEDNERFASAMAAYNVAEAGRRRNSPMTSITKFQAATRGFLIRAKAKATKEVRRALKQTPSTKTVK